MKIVLCRHGEPHIDMWTWISPREIKEWIEAYDNAPVFVGQMPARSRAEATACAVIVCSPLRRSVESAWALCRDREHVREELFREAELPYGQWSFPRLPLAVWVVLLRVKWLLAYRQDIESLSDARARAQRAATRLASLAEEHGSAFLVGHGIMNKLIARELLALGWSGPRRPATRYWQFSAYVR